MRLFLAAALVALAAVIPAVALARSGDEIPVRDCRSRGDPSDGSPIRFAAANDVVVGPVSFSGLRLVRSRTGLGPRAEDGRWFVKSAAKVLWGSPVTVQLVRPDRPLALTYARSGARTASVRFEPCPPGTPMFGGVGRLRRVTAFPGGFSLARTGCYDVLVVTRTRGYRQAISFGAGAC